MHASIENGGGGALVTALAAAGLRFGASNAIEGLGLTLLLMTLKLARMGLRTLSSLLKMLLR